MKSKTNLAAYLAPDSNCRHIKFSAVANEQISCLSTSEQTVLSKGIARAYGKFLRKLFDMKTASFNDLHDYKVLNLFANPSTTFDIDGFQLRVEICDTSLAWTVLSIGIPGSLARYTVMDM